MKITLDFVRQRNRVYLSGDEKAIRYFFHNYGVPLPEDRPLFWSFIYIAILRLCYRYKVVAPTEAEAIRESSVQFDSRGEYLWWMMKERAQIYFETNHAVRASVAQAHCIYQGHLHTVPEELYNV